MTSDYRPALLLGIATGIHTLTGVAFLSWGAVQGRPDLSSSWVRFLSFPGVSVLVLMCAAGEVVVDKLPFVPPRTDPGPLAVRAIVGGLLGAVSVAYGRAEPHDRQRDMMSYGAVCGAVGAVIAAFVFSSLRRVLNEQLHVLQPVAGVIDSTVAILAARIAVQ